MDKKRVAPYPAQAGADGPVAVADGSSVDKGTALEVGTTFLDGRHKTEHHPFEARMIVFAVGVLGYFCRSLHLAVGLVGQYERYYRLRPFDQQPRVATHFGVAFHIVHIGLTASIEPFVERVFLFTEPLGTRYAAVGKTDTARKILYEL